MAIIEKQLSPEQFTALRDDPIAFVRSFDRVPWPYQVDILHEALERDADGQFLNQTVVISLPRQNSKSTMSGWAALWRLYTGEKQEIITVANDVEQASIILNDARRIIRNSKILFGCLDRHGLGKSEIRLKDGSRWLIKSSESVSSRGLRPSLVLYDELGWSLSRDLFDTLSAAQAAQSNPLLIVTSTVGPVMAGILWDLFELARVGSPGVKLIYKQENLSPLITQKYLDRERAILPGVVYAREHENRWGEGSDAFCTEADWKTAIGDSSPLRHKDAGPCWIYVDLGWVHDESAIAVVKTEGEKIAVVALECFQGTHAHPVEFRAVEDKLRDLAKRFHATKVIIESPQGVASAQNLGRLGLDVEIKYPTAKSNAEHWGALYTALKAGQIHLPDDARLRRQLLTLTIKNTATGWKVEDVPSIHQDRAVAIAGAAYAALSGQTREWELIADPFGSTWPPAEGDHYTTDRGWVPINKHAHHSPGATTWQACQFRMHGGCDACETELAESGYFEERAEAEQLMMAKYNPAAVEAEMEKLRHPWRPPPTDEEVWGEKMWGWIVRDIVKSGKKG